MLAVAVVALEGGGAASDAVDRALASDAVVDEADALALWACARIACICCQALLPPAIADVDIVAPWPSR